MNLLDRVVDAFRALAGYEMRGHINPGLDREFFLVPRLRKALDGLRHPYEQHVWVYACISSIVRNLNGIEWIVKEGTREESQPATGIDGRAWVDLMEKPNQAMTGDQFRESVIINHKESGAVFIVKQKIGELHIRPDQVPTELWPISPELFKPVFDEALEKEGRRKLIAWEMESPGSADSMFFDPHEIVVIRHIDPRDPFGWVSPLKSARSSLRRDIKADIFNEAFFDNAAIVGGVINAPDGLSPDQRMEMRKAKESRHSGASKAHRLMVIEGAATFTPAQETHRDMEYLGMVKLGMDVVRGIYGTPKEELGQEEGANMITGAGLVSSNRNYWTRSLIPQIAAIEQAFATQLFAVPSKGRIFIEADLSDVSVLQADLDAAIEQARGLIGIGYTQNQVAKRLPALDMPQVPWGNIAYGDFGMVEIATDETDQAALGDGGSTGEEDTGSDAFDELSEVDDLTEEAEEAYSAEDCSDCGGHIIEANFRSKDRDGEGDEDEASEEVKKLLTEYWIRVAKKTIFPMESTFRKAWKRHVFEMRQETLSRLDGADLTSDDGVRGALLDTEEMDRNAVARTTEPYVKAARRSLNDLKKDFDVDVDISDERLAKIAGRRQKLLASENRNIQRQVRKEMTKARKRGETKDQMLARARKVFTKAGNRSDAIARQEVNSIQNRSRVDALTGAGIKRHTWLTQADGKVRRVPASHNQHGVNRTLGKKWPNGLRFPHDPSGQPGQVQNCRCFTVPAMEERALVRILRRALTRAA